MAVMRAGAVLLNVATVGGLALTAQSVAVRPVPLPLAAGYLGGYLALVALGVAEPRLAMWGEVVCSVTGGRGVALTFEGGPHPEHTLAAARALDRSHARATFFAAGERAERAPDVLRELVARGHEVGVSGHAIDRWLALRGRAAVRDDLARGVDAVERAAGVRPTLFRPAGGLLTPRVFAACDELDLEVVGVGVRSGDHRVGAAAEQIEQRVARGLRDGAIVGLHDAIAGHEGPPTAPSSLAALPLILAAIDDRNLPCVTVSELLDGAPA